jgi:hypothetical protein
MVYYYWIVGGLGLLLLVLSGACWAIFIAMDSPDWHKLSVKLRRWAIFFGLLLFNSWIWARILGVFF